MIIGPSTTKNISFSVAMLSVLAVEPGSLRKRSPVPPVPITCTYTPVVIPSISTGMLITGVSIASAFSFTDVFVGNGMVFISAVGVHAVTPGGKSNLIAIPVPKRRINVTHIVMKIETDFLMGTSRYFDYRSK